MIIGIKKKSETNYVALPDPSKMKCTDELVWASNTGRSSSGNMQGDLKGFKVTVECTWNTIDEDSMRLIRDQIRRVGGFFDLKYYDLGEEKTMTCYASGIPRQLYSMVEGMRYYQDITITFIEK